MHAATMCNRNKRKNTKHMTLLVTCVLIIMGCTGAQDSGFAVGTTGTELGQGILTRVNVERYADIALDIRDFRTLLSEGDSDGALELYTTGRNSYVDAKQTIAFTLQQMSTDLRTPTSARTPAYHYHLYGLADRDVTTSSTLDEHALYADAFVKPLISQKSTLAADAVVALHGWMYATHLLYHGLRTCEQRSKADNEEMFTINGGGMDEFIAMWIGNDQTMSSEHGHSLYDLTQQAGELFDKVRPGQPEAAANSNIKLLYQEGAVALAFPDACSNDDPEDTVQTLWLVTQRIISQMYIPLIQMLIDAIMKEDQNAIRLYSTALIPQISQCRPSVYKRLKDALLDGTTSYNRESTLSDLQAAYDCLGITCQDIGSYQIDLWPECPAIPVDRPLAEYVPTSHVHDHSKIDLDVLQIGILTSLANYPFAQLLYMYGRNSPNYRSSENDPYRLRSLMQMATTTARKNADPFYTEFIKYHNDQNYADKAIQQALEKKGKWASGSPDQIKQLVVTTCAFQVLYMNALTELADAVGACNKGDMSTGEGGAHQWDEVAAFLIGSLEGRSVGGSVDLEDGQLMWNLANRRAFQFQTEDTTGFSRVNVELEDLLFAGRAQANVLDCTNLAKTMDRIQHLILIPVIQSTIRDAILNQGLDSSSQNGELAGGEAFALSVLPIVARYDENAAQLIRANMEVQTGVPAVRDGPQAVANAFYQALDEFGYSCSLVGATPQADACALQGGFANVNVNVATSSSIITSFAAAFAVTMIAMFLF